VVILSPYNRLSSYLRIFMSRGADFKERSVVTKISNYTYASVDIGALTFAIKTIVLGVLLRKYEDSTIRRNVGKYRVYTKEWCGLLCI
jgi:hypothetical protein